jgi:hypothetical protein
MVKGLRFINRGGNTKNECLHLIKIQAFFDINLS